jgi:hypothetical protein
MSTDKSKPTGKASLVIRIAILLILVAGISIVLYMVLTDSGQVMLGNIANQGFSNWLFGEGDLQAEKEVAAKLTDIGVLVIEEQGKGVTSVDFSNCPKPTDEALKQVAKLRHLSTANFLNVEINDGQLANLKNMNHLSNLLLNGTLITDAGLVYLDSMPALLTLHACYTKITDKGMEDIAKAPTLTILNISGTGVTDKGIKQIAKMPELNWLLIQGTKVTDEGLSELSSLPRLGRLTISKSMNITPEAIQKLKKTFPKLQVDINTVEGSPEKPAADVKPQTDIPPAAENGK